MTFNKAATFVIIALAAILPMSMLFQGQGQISVINGALTGVTTQPNYWPMGELSMIGNASATDITVQSTEVLVAGTTTLSGGVVSFDQPQNNRLRYTGTTTALMHVACTMSYTVASNRTKAESIGHDEILRTFVGSSMGGTNSLPKSPLKSSNAAPTERPSKCSRNSSGFLKRW